MPITQRPTHHESGFALVVIAALFIAFAVVGAALVERNTTTQLITRRDSANEQLTKLSNAIIEYAVFNQTSGTLRYPCPARFDLPTSDANFGLSVNTATVQDCHTNSTYTGINYLNANVIRGMIPVQTLSQYGLGVNDAFDPWNNRIMYVVNRALTRGSAANATDVQGNNPTLTHSIITSQAYVAPDFLLISYGRDGVGAIRRESTSASIGCGAGKLRFINCDTDTAFVTGPTYTAASAGDTTYFDDSISGYTQAGPSAAAAAGRAYCWGNGYLGYGFGTTNMPGTQVTLPSGVTAFTSVISGGNASCGIGNNGLPYCWGFNNFGQLGAGLSTGTTSGVPVAVTLPSGVTSFTSIGRQSAETICGIGNNGLPYCWGQNNNGQLGNGNTGTDSTVPVAVTLPSGVTSFTSVDSREGGCGIGNNGRAYCWGINNYGQLGNGNTGTDSNVPVAVTLPSGVTSFTSVSAGTNHNCGIGNNGRVYCWGYNAWLQLGNGTNSNSNVPVAVTLPSGVTSFTSVSAGTWSSCGIGNNGRAYCWGYNGFGQLGDGTNTGTFFGDAPALVTLPSGVTSFTSVSSGNQFSTCGMGNNGRAYCWGYNNLGRLGIGNSTDSNVPVAVTLPSGATSFVSVSAGHLRGCALAN